MLAPVSLIVDHANTVDDDGLKSTVAIFRPDAVDDDPVDVRILNAK